MIFAYFLVQARYHWTQLVGVAICISGLALLVVSDFEHSKSTEAKNRVLGDILMLLGATGYGLSNALEELYVRRAPLYEVRRRSIRRGFPLTQPSLTGRRTARLVGLHRQRHPERFP